MFFYQYHKHGDIVKDDRNVYSLVDIVMISTHQSLLDARNGWWVDVIIHLGTLIELSQEYRDSNSYRTKL